MKRLTCLMMALGIGFYAQAQDLAGVGYSNYSTHPEEEDVLQSSSKEKHLDNLRQLTFGGDNTGAYFSPDGKKVCFQSNNPVWELKCDQTFWMEINDDIDYRINQPLMVSNGFGRTTSSFYMGDSKKIIYSSTFKKGVNCPESTSTTNKSVWSIHSDYDVFIGDEKGKVIKQLTESNGYDAEAVVSPKGDKIVFTSMRDGDLELYIMDANGKNVKRLTNTLGYDGGAFFSPDGTKIVFRASRPQGKDTIEYKELLAKGLVETSNMEIFTMNVDGSDIKQITTLGKTCITPVYHPNGKRIVFSSNHHSINGNDFQLYVINDDGTNLDQITYESEFNAYPMFSPDGKTIIFSSDRNNGGTKEVNVFLTEWVD
jgi:TolB protein